MFEISPFSSFNELIDLEDFMLSHSKLDKYKKVSNNQQILTSKVEDELYA